LKAATADFRRFPIRQLPLIVSIFHTLSPAAGLIAGDIAATPPCHPLMIALAPITPAFAIIAAFSHFRRQLMPYFAFADDTVSI
jgi:hypothetical protein